MKRILSIVLFFLLVLVGCKSTNYINTKDNIDDKDEAIIKEFRSHHGYSNDELKKLEIKYLGTVDNYKIYYVPYKNESEFGDSWVKEGYKKLCSLHKYWTYRAFLRLFTAKLRLYIYL